MTIATGSKSEEWQRYHMLPIAAGLGYATSVIHIYGLGPYIGPISEEFGWSRTLTTAGLSHATLIQALFSIPVGFAVDRLGPRPFALLGILLTAGAFALIGSASGGSLNWFLLWGLMAFATLPVQATVWTSAVTTRFEASRGLALAVTLCGASFAVWLFPKLGAYLIAGYGWKTALAYEAGIWVLIAFPIIFLFFRGAHDMPAKQLDVPDPNQSMLSGISFSEGLRSSIYWRLLLASLMFTFTIIALVVHFIPMLTGRGISPLGAADVAARIGLASIAGRLITGMLLDRFRASLVGAAVFLLPALASLLLIFAGNSMSVPGVAAILIGLTLGAEIDVIAYLTTKHFGLKSFGALYGGLLAALSIGTATGPLGAARIFDVYGNYTPFLWLALGFMIASSVVLISLPKPVFDTRE
jgi:MFS family permease